MRDPNYQKQSPSTRARKQLRDLQDATRQSLKQFAKADPSGTQDERLYQAYQQQVSRIVARGRSQANPAARRQRQRGVPDDFRTAPLRQKLLSALVIAVFFAALLNGVGVFAFLLPLLAWGKTQSFFWSVTLPVGGTMIVGIIHFLL